MIVATFFHYSPSFLEQHLQSLLAKPHSRRVLYALSLSFLSKENAHRPNHKG